VFEFLPWCHPDYSEQDAENWLTTIEANWKESKAYSFAIFSKDGSEFHGGCGINRIDEHPVGNLGYWIKAASIRQGIATEATIGLAEFGIRQIGLQRIEIVMATENVASRAVAESAGALFEGMIRNRLMLHDRPHNAYLYSIIPDDLDT
jgi:RimJ/RimL family protein N-acetyltransferase